jgi:hypothetical protein
MKERHIGAFLMTLFVGGIAGGFGGANLSLAASDANANSSAKAKADAGKVVRSRPCPPTKPAQRSPS